jgi:PGF-CTERM protein
MKRLVSSTLLTALAIVGVCSVLAIGAGTALGQDTARGNNTYGTIQGVEQATNFEFGTPSYVPSDVSFESGSLQQTATPVVRLYWSGEDRSDRLSVQANPRVENSNLFRGNDEIEDTQNITINGQPGDYQQPTSPDGTPTLTFVSANDTVYLVTGTYNRSTLIRVAESIGTVKPATLATTSSGTTNTTPLANTLTIKSTGDERVFYNATASEGMKPAAGADITGADSPDAVSANQASGSTAQNGRDNFTFAGELTGLTISGGPARVLVNGDEVDPESYSAVTPTPTPTTTSTPTPTATETPTATDAAISTTVATSSTISTPANESTSNGSLVASETSNGSGTNSSGSGPGFGIVAAALAILGSTYFVRRRT